jgi:hypothetical protein
LDKKECFDIEIEQCCSKINLEKIADDFLKDNFIINSEYILRTEVKE